MARYDDLDPATRALVDRAIGGRSSTGRARVRARPSKAGSGGTTELRCECGETFATANAMDRHPAGAGHTRVALVLDPRPVTPDL